MLTGGCLCGAVRYETEAADVFHESICHCASCRRAAGAASVAWFSVPRTSLRHVGAPPVPFRSSPAVTRTFCGTCGTALSFASDDLPEEIDITLCSLDDPNQLAPKDHTHAAEALRWDLVDDGLPVYAGSRLAR